MSSHPPTTENYEGVAIVAMSGRFPGARSVDEFWKNLTSGRETISRFQENELEFTASM